MAFLFSLISAGWPGQVGKRSGTASAPDAPPPDEENTLQLDGETLQLGGEDLTLGA